MPKIKQLRGYILEEFIGEGGFGKVYRAYQSSIDRSVAIKMISPDYANRDELVRHFDNEARVIASLEHPNIVPLYDYWRDPSGAYLVMRYYPHGNLQEYLKKEETLSIKTVSNILQQIADALDHATAHRVVHMDIKPANILLDKGLNCYLADFGVAQIIGQSMDANNADDIAITPNYAAPEIFQAARDFSPLSDIYSLGILIYTLLSGHHPFEESTTLLALIQSHLNDPIPPLNAIPNELNDVLSKATHKTPEERFQSATDFAQAFSLAAGGQSIHARSSSAPIMNPFKGLRPFTQSDHNNFFGREALIDDLLAPLKKQKTNFMAIIGPSGSGKSSAIHAGLLPALQQGAVPGSNGCFITTMSPSDNPIASLENALLKVALTTLDDLRTTLASSTRALTATIQKMRHRDDDTVCLVIDQFEEIFTSTITETERQHFLGLLSHAIEHTGDALRLIIIMRADFYDRPLLYQEFGDLLRQNTYAVLPMRTEELQQAIAKPARNANLQIDPGLVTQIIADMQSQVGMLPLLQYTLTELFQRRVGNRLTLEAYQDIGKLQGAIANQAETLYTQLASDEQTALRQLFLRLVSISAEGDFTRCRARLSELREVVEKEDALGQVIDLFSHNRLLTNDRDPKTREPTIEVAHEALFGSWSRLKGWLVEQQDVIHQTAALQQLIADWQGADQDESYLLHGARLAQYEEWLITPTITLTDSEREFIRLSVEQRERQRQAEAAQQQREFDLTKRSRNRLRYLLALAVVAILLTAGLAAYSVDQSEQATLRAEESESLTLLANAQRAILEGDVSLAARLVRIAKQTDTTRPVIAELSHQLSELPGITHTIEASEYPLNIVVFSPDGSRLLTASTEGNHLPISIWDFPTQSLQERFSGHSGAVTDIIFLEDEFVASVDNTGSILVWDVTTGDILQALSLPASSHITLSLSTDSLLLATRYFETDEQYTLWNTDNWREVPVKNPAVEGFAIKAEFHPSGNVISAYSDGSQVLWDFETGEIQQETIIPTGNVPVRRGNYSAELSPDGRLWAVIAANRLDVWNLETSTLRDYIVARVEFVDLAWYPDAHILGMVSSAGELFFLETDVDNPNIRTFQSAQATEVLSFHPDGQHLAVGDVDGTLAVWDIAPTPPDLQLADDVLDANSPYNRGVHLFYTPDSAYFVNFPINRAQGRGALQLRVRATEIDTGNAVIFDATGISPSMYPYASAAFSQDGEVMVTGTSSFPRRDASSINYLTLWDFSDQRMIREIALDEGENVNAIVRMPNENMQFLVGAGSSIEWWDFERDTIIREYVGAEADIFAIAVIPSENMLLGSTIDGQLLAWNTESGDLRDQKEIASPLGRIVAHPSQPWLFYKQTDETLVLEDVRTGDVVRQFVTDSTIQSVALSSDGAWLLTGLTTDVIWWEVETGRVIGEYPLPNGRAQIAFLPDDSAISTYSDIEGVTLWDTDGHSFDVMLPWLEQNRHARQILARDCQLYLNMPDDLCGK